MLIIKSDEKFPSRSTLFFSSARLTLMMAVRLLYLRWFCHSKAAWRYQFPTCFQPNRVLVTEKSGSCSKCLRNNAVFFSSLKRKFLFHHRHFLNARHWIVCLKTGVCVCLRNMVYITFCWNVISRVIWVQKCAESAVSWRKSAETWKRTRLIALTSVLCAGFVRNVEWSLFFALFSSFFMRSAHLRRRWHRGNDSAAVCMLFLSTKPKRIVRKIKGEWLVRSRERIMQRKPSNRMGLTEQTHASSEWRREAC